MSKKKRSYSFKAEKIGFPQLSELLPNLYLVSSSLADASPRTGSYYTSNLYAMRGSQSAAKYKRKMYEQGVNIASSINTTISANSTISKANTILIKAAATERANEMALLDYYFKDFLDDPVTGKKGISSHKEEYGWGEIGKTYAEVKALYERIKAKSGEMINNPGAKLPLDDFYPKVTKLMTLARAGIQRGQKTIAELKAAHNAVTSELNEVYVDKRGKVVTHRNEAGELSGKSSLIQVKGGEISVSSGSAYKTNYLMMANSNIRNSLDYFKNGREAQLRLYRKASEEMYGVFSRNIRSLVVKELMTNPNFIESCKSAVASSILNSGGATIDPSEITKYILSATSSLILEVTREISNNFSMPLEDITKKYQVDANLVEEEGKEYAYSQAYKTLEVDFNKAIERLKANTNTSIGMIQSGQYERYQALMEDAATAFNIKIADTSKKAVMSRSLTQSSMETELDVIQKFFLKKLSTLEAKTKKLEDEEHQLYENYGKDSFNAFSMKSLYDELKKNFNEEAVTSGLDISVEYRAQSHGFTAEFEEILLSMLNGGSSTKVRGSALTDTVSVLIDYDYEKGGSKATEYNMDYSTKRRLMSHSYIPKYGQNGEKRIKSIRDTEASFARQIADQLTKSTQEATRTSRLLTERRSEALERLRNGISETESKLEEEINQYKNILGSKGEKLNNIFVIHNSVKEYQSILQGGMGNKSNFKGFEGREGNLFNMLEMLSDEANATIGSDGLQKLKFAAINSHLVGGIEETLRKYIAKFAAIILFDDYSEIENQEISNIVNAGNVKNIHLFPLNGVYVPLSMILTYMSNQVAKTNKLMQTLSNNPENLVNVTLPNFGTNVGINMANSAADSYFPRDPNTEESLNKDVSGFRSAWDGPGDAVASELRAKITFLSSFLEFLNLL